MDFYPRGDSDATGRSCGVCKVEVAPGEPVFVAIERADDTGTQVDVEHETCHVSIEIARAQVYIEAAKAMLQSESAAAAVLNSRAQRIQVRIDVHRAQRQVA